MDWVAVGTSDLPKDLQPLRSVLRDSLRKRPTSPLATSGDMEMDAFMCLAEYSKVVSINDYNIRPPAQPSAPIPLEQFTSQAILDGRFGALHILSRGLHGAYTASLRRAPTGNGANAKPAEHRENMRKTFSAFSKQQQQQLAAILPDPSSAAGRQATTLALCCAATQSDVLLMQFLEWRDPVSMISYAGGTALAAAYAVDFALDAAGSYSPSSRPAALWLLARGSTLVDCSGRLAEHFGPLSMALASTTPPSDAGTYIYHLAHNNDLFLDEFCSWGFAKQEVVAQKFSACRQSIEPARSKGSKVQRMLRPLGIYGESKSEANQAMADLVNCVQGTSCAAAPKAFSPFVQSMHGSARMDGSYAEFLQPCDDVLELAALVHSLQRSLPRGQDTSKYGVAK